MSRLTLDQVDQLKTTREVDRQIFRGYDVKLGDADKFKMFVALDQQARQRPIYWGGVK
jgi:hypothetical protein